MKGVRMAAKLLLFTVLLLSFAELSVSVLIQLPGFPDPNTDVLFNMQTRRMEETIFLAQETSHVLVEPYYLFGARNWTWFESGNNNQVKSNQDIQAGILGTILEPLRTFFKLPPIESLLGHPILPLHDFVQSSNGQLDLLVRFYGKDLPPCTPDLVQVEAYGHTFTASTVLCLHTSEHQSISGFLSLILGYEAVGILYLPPKFVEHRVQQWRRSDARWAVRSALEWSETIMAMADEYIAQHLSSEEEEEGEGAGGGEAGLHPFLGVHWRRGDRGYRQEMGVHGFVDVALTAPTRLVSFVQEVASVAGGVEGIFLATNCGSEGDMLFVQENLGVVTWHQGGDWRRAALEAVAEQAVLSKAQIIIVPPGVGDPPNVEDTSNFALFVLEQRRIDAAKRNAEPPPYYLCCGASPVMDLWRPTPFSVTQNAGVETVFEVWAAFIPPGSGVMLRVDLLDHVGSGGPDTGSAFQVEDQARVASWTVPVAHPGRLGVRGLPAGRYTVSLFLRGGEQGDEEELPSIAFTLGHEASHEAGHEAGHEGKGGHAVMVTAPISHVLESGELPVVSPEGSSLPQAVTSRTGERLEIEWHAEREHDGSEHDNVGACAERCISHEACVGVLGKGSGSDSEDKAGHGRQATQVTSQVTRCGLLLSSAASSLVQDLTCRGSSEANPAEGWQVWLKVTPGTQPAPITTTRCLPLHYVCMYAS